MRRLTFQSGTAKGAIVDLSGRQVTVGRADENLVVLEDTDVSRFHAVLIRAGDEYQVRDIGSINGVRINGKLVSQGLLQPGDRVEFGLVQASYEQAPPDARPPEPGIPAPAATIVRQGEVQEEIDGLNQLNHELNQQLLSARQELFRAREGRAEQGAEEVQRLRDELASSKKDVEHAREAMARVDELSRRNQQLTAQLGAKDREIVAVKQAAEDRLKREIERVNTELTAARNEVERVRQESEQRLEQELAERRQLEIQLARAEGDRERMGTELKETRERLVKVQGQLDGVRAELDQVKSGSVDMDRLIQDRNQLERQLDTLKKQIGEDRQQVATAPAGDLEELRAALAAARAEIEQHAKKETAKITINAAPDDAEITRLRSELQQTRSDLAAAEHVARRMEVLTKENQAMAAQLTETQREIAALRKESPALDFEELEQLKGDLAMTRAELFRLGNAAGSPASSRGGAPQPGTRQPAAPPGPAGPPRGGAAVPAPADIGPPLDHPPGRLQKFLVGIGILVALGVMFWRAWVPEDADSDRGDLDKPLVENRLIVSPPEAGTETVPVAPPGSAQPDAPGMPATRSATETAIADAAAEAMRQFQEAIANPGLPIEAEGSLPETVSGAESSPRPLPFPDGEPVGSRPKEYLDPKERFRCQLPPDWRLIEEHTSSESKIRLVSDVDMIYLEVHGEDWPVLEFNDRAFAEETMITQFRLRHPATYADKETVRWRLVGGGNGLQMDLKTREDGREGWTRVIEYRQHGRSCTIELTVRNLAQRSLLELIFEGFILSFEVLPPAAADAP